MFDSKKNLHSMTVKTSQKSWHRIC